jgi:hypothetical protein
MWKLRNNIRFISQTGMQLWKTWMIMLTSIALGEALQTTDKFQPKCALLFFFKAWLDEECSKQSDQKKQAI